MKSALIVIIVATASILSNAQSELTTSINGKTENAKTLCTQVQVKNNSNEELKILGQNVRIFFDSDKLSLKDVKLAQEISGSAYSLNIMTEKSGLQKDGEKQLAFEESLGFINYNVNLQNDYLFEGIINPTEVLNVQKICFTKLSSSASLKDIVLAQDGITDKYSRAYTAVESSPTHEDLLLPATLTDMEYQEEIASLHR